MGPTARLVEIWNSFAGVAPFGDLKPVKKFTDRKSAVGRIWKAVQKLANEATETPDVATDKPAKGKRTKAAKKPATTKTGAKDARPGSKQAEVLEMLRRKGGATLAEIMKHTDWQAHTVRGFIAGTVGKKMGIEVQSFRNDDKERTYRIA